MSKSPVPFLKNVDCSPPSPKMYRMKVTSSSYDWENTDLPLIRLAPWMIWETHVKQGYTMAIECKTCMTSLSLRFKPEETANLVDIDKEKDRQVLEKILTSIQYMKQNHDACWDVLGYCAVMFLDWVTDFVTLVLDGKITKETENYELYKHAYFRIKEDISAWEKEVRDVVDS